MNVMNFEISKMKFYKPILKLHSVTIAVPYTVNIFIYRLWKKKINTSSFTILKIEYLLKKIYNLCIVAFMFVALSNAHI